MPVFLAAIKPAIGSSKIAAFQMRLSKSFPWHCDWFVRGRRAAVVDRSRNSQKDEQARRHGPTFSIMVVVPVGSTLFFTFLGRVTASNG
jgi:hypothetical protein